MRIFNMKWLITLMFVPCLVVAELPTPRTTELTWLTEETCQQPQMEEFVRPECQRFITREYLEDKACELQPIDNNGVLHPWCQRYITREYLKLEHNLNTLKSSEDYNHPNSPMWSIIGFMVGIIGGLVVIKLTKSTFRWFRD